MTMNPNVVKLHSIFNKNRRIGAKERREAKIRNSIATTSQKLAESTSILSTTDQGSLNSQNKIIYHDKLSDSLTKGITDRLFHLHLSHGPYRVKYSPNGRHLLLSGKGGDISMLDTHTLTTYCDHNIQQPIHDITFFHNHTLFATSQSKYIHIYDNSCTEVHCIRDTMLTYRLEFLPYHMLLTSIGEFGELTYQDVSLGKVICRHKTKKGTCDVMCSNDKNAIINLGHRNGSITLWTPNIGKPIIEYIGHKGPITAIDTYNEYYIISSGMDGLWKVWDIRKKDWVFSRRIVSTMPTKCISVSQKGIIALSIGPRIEFYNNVFDKFTNVQPFLKIVIDGDIIENTSFQPFEDILCYGSKYAIKNLVVPGSGEPDIDAFDANPYQTKKQQREHEIHQLLDKLPPDTISLNTNIIGTVIDKQNISAQDILQTDLIDPNRSSKSKSNKRKRTSSKLKSKVYNKTFARRRAAIEAKLNEIIGKKPGEMNKIEAEIIEKQVLGENSEITKGAIKGAALSRYYKKK